MLEDLLLVVSYHPVYNFVLLLLHEIGHSPTPKRQLASISVVSLVVVIHNLFSFVFCDVLNVNDFCFLKLVDFNELAQDLVLHYNVTGGSILLLVENMN